MIDTKDAPEAEGAERERFEAWAQRNGISIARTNQGLAFANGQRRAAGDYILIEALCAYAAWIERAALAPDSVVMPERIPQHLERSIQDPGRKATLDEVARLNRRAIPVDLLERCAERLEYHMCSECKEATCCMPGTRAAAVELRALLGKDD